MLDRKGRVLDIMDEVSVPDPDKNKNDIHNHAFVGTVVDILEDRGTAIVEDQCSDFFEIDTDRLEVRA
jgi:hypothetical protein